MKVSHQLMGTCNHKIKMTHKTNYTNLGFVAASLEESNQSIIKPLFTGSGYRYFIRLDGTTALTVNRCQTYNHSAVYPDASDSCTQP